MQKKLSYVLICMAVMAGLMILCSGVGLAADNPKEVKWGIILPLTGPVAPIGINCQRGTILAVEHINKEGGIKSLGGAKIKLVFGDDEAKPDVAMAEAERLIKKEKVDALIGAYTSSCTLPVTQVAEKYEIPIIVPGSGKDEITERGFKYTFRLVGKASSIAKEQLGFVQWLTKKSPIKTIGLLYEDSGWGQSWSKGVKDLFPKMGYAIVADLPYSAQTKDVRSTILRLKAGNPDLVLQESYTADAILITKTMHELQFYTKGIIGAGSGHSNADYHAATGNLKETVMQWEGWNRNIPVQEIKARGEEFQEKFKAPIDVFAAWWYTSSYILAKAMDNAKSVDKKKVRDALSKTNIKGGEKGNLNFFSIAFDEHGQASPISVFTQWINGKMEIVYPEIVATAKVVFPAPQWAERK